MAITLYGVTALTFMMLMYSLERRGRRFVLGFSLSCLLSSVYGFLSGAWPFGVIEAIWSLVAVRRFARTDSREAPSDLETLETVDGRPDTPTRASGRQPN